MPAISLFNIISAAVPDTNIFLWIPVSAVDAAGTNTLFVNRTIIFFISGMPTFVKSWRSLPRNLPDCNILDSRVLGNFMLFV